ncbi:hypothetical protein D3C81_1130240 [compost metagenome]
MRRAEASEAGQCLPAWVLTPGANRLEFHGRQQQRRAIRFVGNLLRGHQHRCDARRVIRQVQARDQLGARVSLAGHHLRAVPEQYLVAEPSRAFIEAPAPVRKTILTDRPGRLHLERGRGVHIYASLAVVQLHHGHEVVRAKCLLRYQQRCARGRIHGVDSYQVRVGNLRVHGPFLRIATGVVFVAVRVDHMFTGGADSLFGVPARDMRRHTGLGQARRGRPAEQGDAAVGVVLQPEARRLRAGLRTPMFQTLVAAATALHPGGYCVGGRGSGERQAGDTAQRPPVEQDFLAVGPLPTVTVDVSRDAQAVHPTDERRGALPACTECAIARRRPVIQAQRRRQGAADRQRQWQ